MKKKKKQNPRKFKVYYDDGRQREAQSLCGESAAQFFAVQALPGQAFTVWGDSGYQTYEKARVGDDFKKLALEPLIDYSRPLGPKGEIDGWVYI